MARRSIAASSARTDATRQTDRRTDGRTDTPTDRQTATGNQKDTWKEEPLDELSLFRLFEVNSGLNSRGVALSSRCFPGRATKQRAHEAGVKAGQLRFNATEQVEFATITSENDSQWGSPAGQSGAGPGSSCVQGVPFTAGVKDLLLQTLPLHPEQVKAVKWLRNH